MVAEFSGEHLTSNGGSLLLRSVDRRTGLLDRAAGCFGDGRDAQQVEHELAVLLRQRIYGLALGYEDLNDHEQLRHDPLLAVVAARVVTAAGRQEPVKLDGREQESHSLHPDTDGWIGWQGQIRAAYGVKP